MMYRLTNMFPDELLLCDGAFIKLVIFPQHLTKIFQFRSVDNILLNFFAFLLHSDGENGFEDIKSLDDFRSQNEFRQRRVFL